MLLGREEESAQIEQLIETSLADGSPLAIYISGVPGTGKTATTRMVIEKLRAPKKVTASKAKGKAKSRKSLKRRFDFVPIDCFASSTQTELYREIVERLGYHPLPANRLAGQIKQAFAEAKNPIIILLDEIDNLSSKKDVLVRKAFSWPTTTNGKVILIGIANSLDLTQRLLPTGLLAKESHIAPKQITFAPYTNAQLCRILAKKLSEDNLEPKAIDLCARKVSAMTGDVRRAFQIADQTVLSMSIVKEAENLNPKEEEGLFKAPSPHRSPARTPDRPSLKRPAHFEDEQTTPKKSACREVLKAIDKVYASPLQRTKLPLHPQILLATFMRLISSPDHPRLRPPTTKDKLFAAYQKICTKLSLPALGIDEMDYAYGVLESQGMISIKPKGRITFEVEFEIARDVINDNAMLSSIESVVL